jgi:hypothetical protein
MDQLSPFIVVKLIPKSLPEIIHVKFSYFFARFGFLEAASLEDFADGGGGVASILRNPASKLMPGNFRFNDLPINYRFTWGDFSTFLSASKLKSQREGNASQAEGKHWQRKSVLWPKLMYMRL